MEGEGIPYKWREILISSHVCYLVYSTIQEGCFYIGEGVVGTKSRQGEAVDNEVYNRNQTG